MNCKTQFDKFWEEYKAWERDNMAELMALLPRDQRNPTAILMRRRGIARSRRVVADTGLTDFV